MLGVFGGFSDFTQAFRLFFEFFVRLAVQSGGAGEFLSRFFLFTQSLIHPSQFVMDRPIMIVRYRNSEMLLRPAKISKFGIRGS